MAVLVFGGDIKAGITSIGFGKFSSELNSLDSTATAFQKFAITTFASGTVSALQGGKFFDAESFARGFAEGMVGNWLTPADESVGKTTEELSKAGTDQSPSGVVEGGGGAENAAEDSSASLVDGSKPVRLKISKLNQKGGYKTQHLAALSQAKAYENDYFSTETGQELLGIIIRRGENQYYFSEVAIVPSTFKKGIIAVIRNTDDVVAKYHTHPFTRQTNQERFSPEDLKDMEKNKLDNYVRTPKGDLRYVTPSMT